MEMARKREAEESRLLQEFHEMIDYNMKEMQQCLVAAGKLLCNYEKNQRAGRGAREVVESVILKECVGCQERNSCRFTVEDKDRLGQMMEEQGGLSIANFRSCHTCQKAQDFVEEANRIYERELFVKSMEQGARQMRQMVGRQYIEAGQMLGEFSGGQFHSSEENKRLYMKILKGFSRGNLKVREIYFYENQERGKQIYLYLKKRKGKEIPARQAAAMLSQVVQRKMEVLPGQKKMIGHKYEMFGFAPAAKFHVLGGVLSVPYQEGSPNGDSFSMDHMGKKRFVSMISDGMGTGEAAREESRRAIEILEELLGAGIQENQAIRMWQSMFSFWTEKERYATLDYFQLDLFAGVGTFLKIGACPCFLKRKGKAEIIETESLPVGFSENGELPFYRKKLESEDLVLQISDGVIDALGEDAPERIRTYMEEIHAIRPQAFAEQLFHKIEKAPGYEKTDDMTILALGIWDRY